ncbi:hypothetical protein A359_09090 [secondary endosymbiont of Ctenarytaina eucalypti]|uniref:Uncharacterized protein n=1 Tax=secondary endosymbiont of Ctenarytaina eucalypti TaxID=1199245 RepID=J3TY59_9ENTR|nr:hypothetical protein A359_09090 [secondary endosymbiont of Ctenarytaina eucalypti]
MGTLVIRRRQTPTFVLLSAMRFPTQTVLFQRVVLISQILTITQRLPDCLVTLLDLIQHNG